MYTINKLQEYTAQHSEYSQCFIITLNRVQPSKIMNHYVVHVKHIS